MIQTFADEARALSDLGFSVIPIGRNKRPRIPGATKEERGWNPYRKTLAPSSTLAEWFAPDQFEAMAIVCGALSGQRYGGYLVALDLERRTDHESMVDRRPLHDETAVQYTGGGGAHTFFISRRPVGNLEIIDPELSQDDPDHHVGDVRGEGGYAIVAPSLHPSGRRYTWVTPPPRLLVVDDGTALIRSLVEPLGYQISTRGDDDEPAGERSPIAELLGAECAKGSRHRTLIRIAGWARNLMSVDQAEALCQLWNARCCRPQLPDVEVVKTVEDIYARYEALQSWELELGEEVPPGETAAWTVMSARQLRRMELPPIEWVLDGIVPRGRYTVVSGESGLGKSWWILAYCICAAIGMPFLGRETVLSRTLYIDEENGIQEAQRRLRALCDGLGVDPDEEVPIYFLIDAGVKLGRPNDLNRMMETIAAHGITNVVTDSLIRVFEGNENKSEDVGRFHAMVDHVRRKTGVTWWMLQHLNKPNPNGHTAAGDRIRGSGDFKAHADVHIHLRGADSTGTVVIHVEKLRGAPRPSDSVYRMEGDTRKGEPVRLVAMGETAAALGAMRGAAMEACNVLDLAGSLSVTELIGELGRLGISERTAKRGIADARASGAIEVDRTEGRSVYLRVAEPEA